MPEGAQLISLTKTFASQILKDYPESLKNTGLETMEPYMEYLSDSRHIRNLEDRFYQLLQGMEQCLESLLMVKGSVEDSMPEDFYSIDLMNAYEQLGFIIGEAVDDDVVNEIFAKFCMGK